MLPGPSGSKHLVDPTPMERAHHVVLEPGLVLKLLLPDVGPSQTVVRLGLDKSLGVPAHGPVADAVDVFGHIGQAPLELLDLGRGGLRRDFEEQGPLEEARDARLGCLLSIGLREEDVSGLHHCVQGGYEDFAVVGVAPDGGALGEDVVLDVGDSLGPPGHAGEPEHQDAGDVLGRLQDRAGEAVDALLRGVIPQPHDDDSANHGCSPILD